MPGPQVNAGVFNEPYVEPDFTRQLSLPSIAAYLPLLGDSHALPPEPSQTLMSFENQQGHLQQSATDTRQNMPNGFSD